MGKSPQTTKFHRKTVSTKPIVNNKRGDDGPSSIASRTKQQSQSTSTSSLSTKDLLPLPFPAHLPKPPNHDFLVQDESPYQESFQVAVETSYEGFVVDDRFHERKQPGTALTEDQIQTCLQYMQTQHYFQKDVTQPFGLGTKCAPTYVTRCLVGDPGTTYKYLGLRMFAHPWSSSSISGSNSSGSSGTGSRSGDLSTGISIPNPAMVKTLETTKQIHDLSICLSQATRKHLHKLDEKRRLRGSPPTQGRATFDICLINRMDPTEPLKSSEPSSHILPHLGTSVSWHADSSLEHYSTIAVYQTLMPHSSTSSSLSKSSSSSSNMKQPSQKKQRLSSSSSSSAADQHPWYVAMRVTPHCEGPTASHQRKGSIQSTVDVTIPPIAARLPSGSVYYLLDDFNHHHQHTVLRKAKSGGAITQRQPHSSSPIRYSCTFRLLRESHTIQYMIQRCQSATSQFHKKGLKLWRSEQLLLGDVESEWIRQFYIQGSHHYDLLWEPYWKKPFGTLLKYWSQFEERTYQIIQWLELAARGKCRIQTHDSKTHIMTKVERKMREKEKKAMTNLQGLLERGGPEDHHLDADEGSIFYETMAEFLEERASMRELWAKRERDHAFTELAPELRPMPVPFQFVDTKDNMAITPQFREKGQAVELVRSPLPGLPSRLREVASAMRALGTAFVSGRAADLPEMTFVAPTQNKPKDETTPPDDQHSKPLTWSGWGQGNTAFGLELQDPWAGAILDGRKEIETRSYELPSALIGKRIWILESPSGKAGVSALDNVIDFQDASDHSCKIVGWCRFTLCIRYNSREQFEIDKKRHLVSPNSSGYSWKKGQTTVLYGWVVGDHGRVNSTSFVSGARRMRSLFELKQQQQQQHKQQPLGKRKTLSRDKQNQANAPQKTKKKRY